jgi:hypothetical protein
MVPSGSKDYFQSPLPLAREVSVGTGTKLLCAVGSRNNLCWTTSPYARVSASSAWRNFRSCFSEVFNGA